MTLSTPAIDPSGQFVYAMGPDMCAHKYAVGGFSGTIAGEYVGIGSGSLMMSGNFTCLPNGWPALVTNKKTLESVKGALTIGTTSQGSFLYVPVTGGDAGNYQGSITTINLTTGTQHVFNALCSGTDGHFPVNGTDCTSAGASLWQRGGVTFDPLTNRVYGATGNQVTGTAYVKGSNWGESIVALNADGTSSNGLPADSYTPGDWAYLAGVADLDMSNTNMLILANNGTAYPHLGAHVGKDGYLRLINLDNMGQSQPVGPTYPDAALSKTYLPQLKTVVPEGSCNANSCGVTGPIATWINPADNKTWVYVNAPGGLNAMVLTTTNPPAFTSGWHTTTSSHGGVFVANGVLYYADTTTLWVLNAATGALITSFPVGVSLHQTPVVVNGILYFNGMGYAIDGNAPPMRSWNYYAPAFIGATCLPWSDLNSASASGSAGQASPGNVYISGALPGTSSITSGLPNPAPAPTSGFAAQKSGHVGGQVEHQHYFTNATATLPVPGQGNFNADDKILLSIFIDPSDPPAEVMVQFFDENNSWEHRAFWGPDIFPWGAHGTGAHKQESTTVPATGSWQSLGVLASDVGLWTSTGTHHITGMAFTIAGGSAYWDNVYYLKHGAGAKIMWVDDAPPAGAGLFSDVNGVPNQPGDGWVWTTAWSNNSTATTLAGNQWDMCQISGLTGTFPSTGSPGRNVVLDWPGQVATYAGDASNTGSNWVLHETKSVAGDRVSTSCADFSLKSYASILSTYFGYATYTQALPEFQTFANTGTDTDVYTFNDPADTDQSICWTTGLVGQFWAGSLDQAFFVDDGYGTWSAETWGNLNSSLSTCYMVTQGQGGWFQY